VSVLIAGSKWTLQIGNNDTGARRFTCRVADNDGTDGQGAHRPWIDVARQLTLTGAPGSTAAISSTVTVPNDGTGALTINPDSGGLADPLSVLTPAAIQPNSCGKLTIVFDPTKSGPNPQMYVASSNDGRATDSATHNRTMTVSLQATSPEPEPPPDPGKRRCRNFSQCRCDDYQEPFPHHPGPNDNCARPSCRHPNNVHELPQ
jgi:hypothetical protein